jgi:hypothetical protein
MIYSELKATSPQGFKHSFISSGYAKKTFYIFLDHHYILYHIFQVSIQNSAKMASNNAQKRRREIAQKWRQITRKKEGVK